MKNLIIYGASEFGQVIKPLAQQCGHEIVGFVDDWHVGNGIVAGDAMVDAFPPAQVDVVIGIGYRHLSARKKIFERIKSLGYSVAKLIHAKAIIDASAQIGEGAIIMAGAIVDVRARVGALAVVWPGAIVNHDSRIGDNSFLSPGAVICGHTEVAADCFIGAGAVVVDHLYIQPCSFIKAGSVFSGK